MAADDASPVRVIVLGGRRIVIRSDDAARLILWIVDHQDDLEGKGAWTFDHTPGHICAKRTIVETI